MRVLVACEFSGRVRDEFIARGHDAWSCDLLESERPGPHIVGDCRELFGRGWDMLVAFPPCTHLAVSGARWFVEKKDGQEQAVEFFLDMVRAPIERIAVENPVGIMSTRYRRPTQIIQPWEFGHGETKATCLWLKNLPVLMATNVVEGREPRVHYESPGPERWRRRSETYQGVAQAMAAQWGGARVAWEQAALV